MNRTAVVAAIAGSLLVGSAAGAQSTPPKRLVPQDIKGGVDTGRIDLGDSFPGLKGYVLVQHLTTVPPGQGKAWHGHADRPEIMRVLSGTLTEARNDEPPRQYGPGSTLVDDRKTQHMWANLGTEPVVLLSATVQASPPVGGRSK